MRVAMMGWEYQPWLTGGLGTHCTALVRELAIAGANVDLFVPVPEGGPDGAAPPRNVHLHPVLIREAPAPYAQGQHAVFPLMDAVRAFTARVTDPGPGRPDVVHAHDWMTVPAGIVLARATKRPLVLTLHSTELDRAAGSTPHPMRLRLEREGAHAADVVITVSERSRQSLVDALGVDPRKVVVIHNGVDATRFSPRAARGDADGPVLFMGRLARQKGPDVLVDAAARVLARRDATFTIAGEGEMRTRLIARVRRRGLQDHVHFPGRVPEDALPDLYRGAAVYVLPSREEPFGITVLEAMSAGTPVIASENAGVCEVVHAVMRVPPGDADALADAVGAVLDAPALRRRLAEDALREAGAFTWAETARQTRLAYAAAVDAQPVPDAFPRLRGRTGP